MLIFRSNFKDYAFSLLLHRPQWYIFKYSFEILLFLVLSLHLSQHNLSFSFLHILHLFKKIELYFMIHVLHSVVSSPTAFSFGTLLLNSLPVSSSLMLGDRQIPPCLDLGAFELLVNSEIDSCMRVLETMVFSSRMC